MKEGIAMSATVTLSEKPCFFCKGTEKTLLVKLKDGTFQGVVCDKHLWQVLNHNGKPEEK
jgi:hypothetical protein